jgi:uncharacterized membrane protein YhaH (DUF805 family)
LVALALFSWAADANAPGLIGIGWVIIAMTQYFLAVGRVHDFGYSAWWALLLFVPLVGLIFGIYIYFPKSAERGDKINAVL